MLIVILLSLYKYKLVATKLVVYGIIIDGIIEIYSLSLEAGTFIHCYCYI